MTGGKHWSARQKGQTGNRDTIRGRPVEAVAQEQTEVAGGRVFALQYEEEDLEKLFEQLGQMPLPPYIHEQLDDPERYQTVFPEWSDRQRPRRQDSISRRSYWPKSVKKESKWFSSRCMWGLELFVL